MRSIERAQRSEIIAYMARTLWVTDWADRMESRGALRGYAECELMEVAPPATVGALRNARKLARAIERANGCSVAALYQRAIWQPCADTAEYTAQDFGFCLVMESLGSGVAWSDNHPAYPHELPHCEYHRGTLYI